MKPEDKSTGSGSQLLPVDPFDLVVVGAAGDLALRKLFPALFHRWKDGQIPSSSKILGVSRSPMTREEFSSLAFESFCKFRPGEKIHQADWAKFSEMLDYFEIDVAEQNPDWDPLKQVLGSSDQKKRIFYLALPPSLYGPVSENIAAAGLNSDGARIVLEKPIGTDLSSAKKINDAVGAVFDEKSIFRIDHYLGKETVQNLIVLRFMNSLFEPVWNANAIDHVQISVCESIGSGGRAGYYDTSGALRDMVQNHLLQLLCLVAMEPPLDLSPDTLRDEKIKVLRALRPIDAEHVRTATVRGQYGSGAADGMVAESYAAELGKESSTETYVALSAHIDNWRWKGTPFYLRTGKRMASRYSEIIIQFKEVAHVLVDDRPVPPSRMVIRLQPDEGVKMLLVTKDPGPGGMRLRYVPLNLSYAEQFDAKYPDAYERLLMAVVRGDLGLFMRRDEVEAAWRWVDGILDAWAVDNTPINFYAAGTDGPIQSAMLMDREGREWFGGI